MIRQFLEKDLKILERVQHEYYAGQISIDDLLDTHYLKSFVITDDKDDAVIIGGIRTIAEAIALTDKSRGTRVRREALLEFFKASIQVAEQNNYTQLHAFIHDNKWGGMLRKYNFLKCSGQAMYLKI